MNSEQKQRMSQDVVRISRLKYQLLKINAEGEYNVQMLDCWESRVHHRNSDKPSVSATDTSAHGIKSGNEQCELLVLYVPKIY